MYLADAESMLFEDVEPVVHELVIVRFITCGALELFDTGRLGKFYPDLRDQNTFKV